MFVKGVAQICTSGSHTSIGRTLRDEECRPSCAYGPGQPILPGPHKGQCRIGLANSYTSTRIWSQQLGHMIGEARARLFDEEGLMTHLR